MISIPVKSVNVHSYKIYFDRFRTVMQVPIPRNCIVSSIMSQETTGIGYVMVYIKPQLIAKANGRKKPSVCRPRHIRPQSAVKYSGACVRSFQQLVGALLMKVTDPPITNSPAKNSAKASWVK
jgi:hypothetical protein